MKKFLQWWVTPKLPKQHYIGKNKDFMAYLKTWIYHPIKRRFAKYYLFILKKFFKLQVIGISGSAGKTTTKEMLASVLGSKYKVVWSKANIDPVFNIPSTILRCKVDTQFLILEMGIEYPGEMDFYLWLAQPDFAILTNIFSTHTLYLKNETGVAKEKGKLIKAVNKNGVVALNSDNKFSKDLSLASEAKVVWFKNRMSPTDTNKDAVRVLAENFDITKNVIQKKLNNYKIPEHRLNFFRHKSGAYILDDCYNSNPEAYLAVLDVFLRLAKKNKKIAVIGDMLELGKLEKSMHKKIGVELSKHKFVYVVGVGIAVKHVVNEIKLKDEKVKTTIFSNNVRVFEHLVPFLKKNNYIFIKGSRSIGLDKVVDKLL